MNDKFLGSKCNIRMRKLNVKNENNNFDLKKGTSCTFKYLVANLLIRILSPSIFDQMKYISGSLEIN